MVFSRYVTVVRRAGSSLRRNLLESEVKPKSRYQKADFRVCAMKAFPGGSENVVDNPEPKILILNSKPAASYGPKDHGSKDTSDCLPFVGKFRKNDDSPVEVEETLTVEELDRVQGIPGALETCEEDISHITPFKMPSFNFAAYANNSETIQELAKLGVELWKVERRRNAMELILGQNFSDMKPYIRFLADCGVPATEIGAFITKNPYIFTQDIDDLHTRIRYLRAHKFDKKMVARIVTVNPDWLSFSTKQIDEKLGHFQKEFDLSGHEIRTLATKQPKVVTYDMTRIVENTFALREEMGFDKIEVKTLIVDKPRILTKSRKKIVEIFDYVHNTMGIPHELLCRQSFVLFSTLERIRNRHRYLEALGKNQYDPKKPGYISPNTMISGLDVIFCQNVAKTTVETYNLYLKSL